MELLPNFVQPEDLFALGKDKQRHSIYPCPHCLAPFRRDKLDNHIKSKHYKGKGKYNKSFDFLGVI
jgi:hypothetical protein